MSASDKSVNTVTGPVLAAGMTLLVSCGTVQATEFFNPAFLSGDPQAVADLSRFEKNEGQAPGTYRVEVYLNNELIRSQDMQFIARTAADSQRTMPGSEDMTDDSGLTPCLTRSWLEKLNVSISRFPELETVPDTECVPLSAMIPQSGARFDFDQQRLYISIPQAALTNNARGYIPPDEWDEGIPALLLDYGFTGSNSRNADSGYSYNSYFLNLNSGANIGLWRLRNHSTWNYSSGGGNHNDSWRNISTYAERSIIPLRSTLLVGDSSSSSAIFDSLGFRGAQIASEDTMLPDSQRGFAPAVRGVAKSHAKISIRQNGYVIYQTYVPPGAFDIQDLYPTSSSGDLQITVTESDGSVTQFTVPYSTVPLLQREGRIRYAVTGGQYRSGSTDKGKPGFGQGTLQWGLPGGVTVYGGTQLASDYRAFAVGAGLNMGAWGAISADLTQANSTLADRSRHQGQSLRFLYAKSLNETGTTFQLLGYRYSTQGFYTLDDTAYRRMSGYRLEDNPEDGSAPTLLDAWNLNYTKKGKAQVSINQQVSKLGTLYITGSQQTYWRTERTTDLLQTGYNGSWKGVNYSLSYYLNRNPWMRGTDRSVALSVSVPLGDWLTRGGRGADITRSGNTAYATYSASHDNSGKTSQQAGISGTLLADNNLSYSVMQGYANQGEGNSGSTALDWQGGYGRVNAGYNYSHNYQQVNYGLRGGVVAHENGITFSQSLGDTNVLVKAPGASDVRVENATGVSTDWRGYAVVPYATTYRRNRIALDATTLKENADLEDTVASVVPTKGALVRAQFSARTGARAMVTLLRTDGKPVPFGTLVAVQSEDGGKGIVGDGGQVYLSGLSQAGTLKAVWGDTPSRQCVATWSLPEQNERHAISYAQAECR